jgi:hypothetical protein
MLAQDELVSIEKFIIETKDRKALKELKEDLSLLIRLESDRDTKTKLEVLMTELSLALGGDNG